MKKDLECWMIEPINNPSKICMGMCTGSLLVCKFTDNYALKFNCKKDAEMMCKAVGPSYHCTDHLFYSSDSEKKNQKRGSDE